MPDNQIEPVLLEVDHCKLLGLRWVVLLLFLGDMCDLALVEGVVALVLPRDPWLWVVVSVDNCERYVLDFHNNSRLLPWVWQVETC